MNVVARPFVWFYTEFGLAAVKETGRDAWLIIIARALRMLAYGTSALVLALFLAAAGFTDTRIGLFMTLTLCGDVVLGTALTLIADRFGRRKILLIGSSLMVVTGVMFATLQNFWMLLFAAVVGVVSATGGDFGPFRSIEESILSQLTTPKTRADVLSWYVTLSAVGSTIGSEAAGRIIDRLQKLDWSLINAYQAIFWIYAAMGIVNAVLVLLLSDTCEAEDQPEKYTQVQQDESENDSIELIDHPERTESSTTNANLWYSKTGGRLFFWTGTVSSPTVSIMYKLWILLSIDSLADGMVPYSITNYFIDRKWHPSKSALGDVTSVSYILTALGGMFAGPLARKIGLVNTMVYTHIPSSTAVLVFPFPQTFWMATVLLFVRAGLNNLDQAPRSALIAGLVRPEERTAVMGITTMVRTLAATSGPMVTGLLAGSNRFWLAFVAGGACRLVYDVGLWVMFVNVKLNQHEQPKTEAISTSLERRLSAGEEIANPLR